MFGPDPESVLLGPLPSLVLPLAFFFKEDRLGLSLGTFPVHRRSLSETPAGPSFGQGR